MRVYVDTREFEKLRSELKKFSKKALPYAARNTLNRQAFHMQQEWRGEVRKTFTNRNKFTAGSIRVDKAKGLNLETMRAVTGSVAPYMGDQEEGAKVPRTGKRGGIPAPLAGGGKPGSGARPKLVRAPYKRSAISVQQTPMRGYGRRRQNAIALAIAIRKGERFALLNRANGKKGRGLFEVKGLKRKAKTRLIWSVGRASVRVKPEPTMQRSFRSNRFHFERFAAEELRAQMQRQRLFNR